MTEKRAEYRAGQRPVDEILDDLLTFLWRDYSLLSIQCARLLDAHDFPRRPPWLGALVNAQEGHEAEAVEVARDWFLKDVKRLLLGLGPEVRDE